jgi:hypothetical protein
VKVTDTYTIVRYRSPRPVRVTTRPLLTATLGEPPAGVLLERP